MSDVRIGLVAEGKTDLIIINAALKSILKNRTFILQPLQPETSAPFGGAGPHGGGWGGVYRWCRQLVSMQEPVGENPSLAAFDLILFHLDADVAGEKYSNANITDGLEDLPCQRPCPPATDSVDALRKVITGWLGLSDNGVLPDRWVFCNPSMCPEAWLIAALYRDTEPGIMSKIECNPNLENWLSQRPISEGGRFISHGKKRASVYQEVSPRITAAWGEVCARCSQAHRFTEEVLVALT